MGVVTMKYLNTNYQKRKYYMQACDTILFMFKSRWIVWWCNLGAFSDEFDDGSESIISHYCSKQNVQRISSSILVTNPICPCGEKVPEDILTVWKLHNFGNISRYVIKAEEENKLKEDA